MTDPKQAAFLAEYKALCERHGLMLYPEHLGDPLYAGPMSEGEDPLDIVKADDGETWPDIEGVIGVRECAPLSGVVIMEENKSAPGGWDYNAFLAVTDQKLIKATKLTDPLE